MADIGSSLWVEQVAAVEEVLGELGVQGTRRIVVYNKIDLLPEEARAHTTTLAAKGGILVSARECLGLDQLVRRISEELESFSVRVELKIPYSEAAVLSRLHERARITSEVYEKDGVRVDAELPRSAAYFLRRFLAEKPESRTQKSESGP